jgi:hypothetical protein
LTTTSFHRRVSVHRGQVDDTVGPEPGKGELRRPFGDEVILESQAALARRVGIALGVSPEQEVTTADALDVFFEPIEDLIKELEEKDSSADES